MTHNKRSSCPVRQVNINKASNIKQNYDRLALFSSLPLLIIITVALNTSQSESAVHLPSSGSSATNQVSNILRENDSMMPVKISTAIDHPTNLDELREAASGRQQVHQHELAYHNSNNNNVISRVVMLRQGNQLPIQPMHSQKLIQFPHVILDSAAGLNSTTSRITVGDRETILATTKSTESENFNQQLRQLKPTINASLEKLATAAAAAAVTVDETGGQIMQQVVDGGPLDGDVAEMREQESKDSFDGQLKDRTLERRLGLFKKGRSNNNNLANPSYTMVPYSNECERCLTSSDFNSQGATWSLEPQAYGPGSQQYYNQPYNYLNQQQLQQSPFQVMFASSSYHTPLQKQHHYDTLRNKLNKFQTLKSVPSKQYPGPGKNYQYYMSKSSNKYRMPISSGRPVSYQPAQQNQMFNCVQPALLGSYSVGGGGGGNPFFTGGTVLPNQGLTEEDVRDL